MSRAFLHYEPGHLHQLDAMIALASGLAHHGVHVDVCDRWDAADRADMVVCWGDKVPRILDEMPRMILEAGYINGQSGDYHRDRLRFVSTGWNGLHGRADRGPSGCPPDRWEKLRHAVKPWQVRRVNQYLLICDQHPGDACAPEGTRWRLAQDQARLVAARVIYRPHPLLAPDMRPLHEALADAHTVLTWSSTAAIEAVIAGVPTIAMDEGSMAWPVTSHGLDRKEFLGDRSQWLYDLAYRQWTHDELRSGEAWETLKENLPK